MAVFDEGEGILKGSYKGTRTDPATFIRKILVVNEDLEWGPCRGVIAAADGTITFQNPDGSVVENFPVFKGYNPFSVRRVTASTQDLWAAY